MLRCCTWEEDRSAVRNISEDTVSQQREEENSVPVAIGVREQVIIYLKQNIIKLKPWHFVSVFFMICGILEPRYNAADIQPTA